MKILGVIPARHASTRFPGKPLVDLGGKTMIRRVYEQVKKATTISHVVVATDHEEIFRHVKDFGGEVCMTAANHVSGTDRCFEALTIQKNSFDYIINVQGDEPFIQPEQIDLLGRMLDGRTEIATLVKQIDDEKMLFNPNVVKVVINGLSEALYFSRSPVPHVRNTPESQWLDTHIFYKHIGLYAYRADILGKITSLPIGKLEKAESLEQLRWLENGFHITVGITAQETIGIDTPEDMENALRWLKQYGV
jgi:3-deoxy-manno-octulosonate cytidylyltransferase (CMP-KDO synthetase)